jgi:hypothetical protein
MPVNVYQTDLRIYGTAYIKAESKEEALKIARGLRRRGPRVLLPPPVHRRRHLHGRRLEYRGLHANDEDDRLLAGHDDRSGTFRTLEGSPSIGLTEDIDVDDD